VPNFYVERALSAPLTAAAGRSLWRTLESCARAYPVRWHECLVDAERRRIVCGVEATDLPAARAAARCSGMEPDATWLSALPIGASTTAHGQAKLEATAETCMAAAAGTEPRASAVTRIGLVDVMAEWRLDAPVDALHFARAQNVCDWCLDAMRVRPGSVATSADRRRVVAFFRAPDAEAVRNAYRYATIPFDRVIALRRLDR
jgi:hypothetical protein